jgi:hypothetical protein
VIGQCEGGRGVGGTESPQGVQLVGVRGQLGANWVGAAASSEICCGLVVCGEPSGLSAVALQPASVNPAFCSGLSMDWV